MEKNIIILLIIVVLVILGVIFFFIPKEKESLIKVYSPMPNELIESPVIIKGEAKGFWYFEASFPVYLYDENDNMIAMVIAQAKEDWMTEEFVPFEIMLNFNKPEVKNGYFVFEKSNPSGLPENEDKVTIPVRF